MARRPKPIGLPRTGRSIQKEFIGPGQAQPEMGEWTTSPRATLTAMADALVEAGKADTGAAALAEAIAGSSGQWARTNQGSLAKYGLGESGDTRGDQRGGSRGPLSSLAQRLLSGTEDHSSDLAYWDDVFGWVVNPPEEDDGVPSTDPRYAAGDDAAVAAADAAGRATAEAVAEHFADQVRQMQLEIEIALAGYNWESSDDEANDTPEDVWRRIRDQYDLDDGESLDTGIWQPRKEQEPQTQPFEQTKNVVGRIRLMLQPGAIQPLPSDHPDAHSGGRKLRPIRDGSPGNIDPLPPDHPDSARGNRSYRHIGRYGGPSNPWITRPTNEEDGSERHAHRKGRKAAPDPLPPDAE